MKKNVSPNSSAALKIDLTHNSFAIE